MSFEFRASSAEDLPHIIGLMQAAFSAPAGAPFLDPALLRWKYFEPGPPGPIPRSHVLTGQGRLLAHGCPWPVSIDLGGERYSAICLLDWAAVPDQPGVGIQLVRKLSSTAQVLISIGGSEHTKKLMPRIGFRLAAEQSIYARVLRPWRQFRNRPGGSSLKNLARLVRNAEYRRKPLAPSGGWSARTASLNQELLATATWSEAAVSLHSQDFLQFMKRCPGAKVRTFELAHPGKMPGYFVLSEVNSQSRIAEFRMASRDVEDWTAGLSAAARAATESTQACELIAYASTPIFRQSLELNGFQLRGKRPVFIQAPTIPCDRLWDLNMLDDDSAFLNLPEYPFVT